MEDISKLLSKKKKCYLSDKTKALIDSLIAVELNASQLYKAGASWCEYVGYEGTAKFLDKHSNEERTHMNKLYEYSLDRQCCPITPSVKEQPHVFVDLKDVLEKSLQHEEFVETQYKNAIKAVMSEGDMQTFAVMQFFLNEQVEEIKLFAGLLDRLEIIGYDKKGMFFLDQEIAELT